MNPSDPMQNALDNYCKATIPRHAPKQGITLVIDSGTGMRSINLNKLLTEHDVMCGIENIVAVPVHSCQKLLENKEVV